MSTKYHSVVSIPSGGSYRAGTNTGHALGAVRYVLWDTTGWPRDYNPPVWRKRATEEQKYIGWEVAVRMEKIIYTVLDAAHKRQVEEAMDTLSRGRGVL